MSSGVLNLFLLKGSSKRGSSPCCLGGKFIAALSFVYIYTVLISKQIKMMMMMIHQYCQYCQSVTDHIAYAF